MSEFQETQPFAEKIDLPILDLKSTEAYDKEIFMKEIQISSDLLGASQWRTLLEETSKDSAERGLFISANKKGEIQTSKIYKGKAEKRTDGKVSEDGRPYFDMSPVSRNFTQLLHPSSLFQKDIVIVHSHPDGYPTFSGHDICAYSQTDGPAKDANGFVMINNNGVHLLIGPHREIPLGPIEKKYQEIKIREISDLEKTKEMALVAKEYGLGYYFQPNVDEKKPYISFKKATDL